MIAFGTRFLLTHAVYSVYFFLQRNDEEVKAKLCNTRGSDNDKEIFFTLQILLCTELPGI
jgi:hypothetical protein